MAGREIVAMTWKSDQDLDGAGNLGDLAWSAETVDLTMKVSENKINGENIAELKKNKYEDGTSNVIIDLELCRVKEEVLRKDEDLARKVVELAKKDEELAKKNEELTKKDQELKKKDETISFLLRLKTRLESNEDSVFRSTKDECPAAAETSKTVGTLLAPRTVDYPESDNNAENQLESHIVEMKHNIVALPGCDLNLMLKLRSLDCPPEDETLSSSVVPSPSTSLACQTEEERPVYPNDGKTLLVMFADYEAPGTDANIKYLQDLFCCYDSLPPYFPKTEKKMKDILKILSRADFSDVSHLVVGFFGHGSEGKIDLGEDYFCFNEVEKCLNKNESLKGKPKLFIVICCQGKKNDYIKPPRYPQSNHSFRFCGLVDCINECIRPTSSPQYDDVCYIYAAQPGHQAWADDKRGSYLIKHLANTDFMGRRLLADIIPDAIRKTKEEIVGCKNGGQAKQHPCTHNNLSRDVQFSQAQSAGGRFELHDMLCDSISSALENHARFDCCNLF